MEGILVKLGGGDSVAGVVDSGHNMAFCPLSIFPSSTSWRAKYVTRTSLGLNGRGRHLRHLMRDLVHPTTTGDPKTTDGDLSVFPRPRKIGCAVPPPRSTAHATRYT